MKYKEFFEQRAAILQFDAGLSQEEAENIAFREALLAMSNRLESLDRSEVARHDGSSGKAGV